MTATPDSIVILIPTFNGWEALRMLLPAIDRAFLGSKWRPSVLVVDDGSPEPLPEHWPGQEFATLQSVKVLHLKCTLGCQRAIALGLYHVHEYTDAGAVIIMHDNGG